MIIPEKEYEIQESKSTVLRFLKRFKIGKLLKECNCRKTKGISVLQIFTYLINLVFMNGSMYMQMKTGKCPETFDDNTAYRFLNNAKANWEKFLFILSERIINGVIRNLTSENRVDAFIVDDSFYRKRGYKSSELVSWVFDHVAMKTQTGFRMLTLGWTDGATFIPIFGRLLASSKIEMIRGIVHEFDKRTLAHDIRRQACTKATELIVEVLKKAVRYGHKAKYVLFDSWFASPASITKIKNETGLDTIAMIKKSGKVNYEYEGKMLNIKQIFSKNKKRRGRSKYLLSVFVNVITKENGRIISSIPAKIVFVRNRNVKSDWLALISTDTNVTEEEIIRIYGKRWDIEVFFKTCKSMLKLTGTNRSTGYDAMTCYMSIVFVRYMIISLEKRNNTDWRTAGEMFFLLCEEVSDISLTNALTILIEVMMVSIKEFFGLSEERINEFYNLFVSKLPDYIKKTLCVSEDSAVA